MWFGSGKSYWTLYKEVMAVDKWVEDLLCGDLAKETSSEMVGEIFQLCWAIWKACNLFVSSSKPPNPEVVIDQAKKANTDYFQAVYNGVSAGASSLLTNNRDVRWVPPPPSYVKFNVDGAFKSSRSLAAFGIIARDSGGSVLLWCCGRAMVSSAIAIEAWALRIACVMAMEQGYSDVILET